MGAWHARYNAYARRGRFDWAAAVFTVYTKWRRSGEGILATLTLSDPKRPQHPELWANVKRNGRDASDTESSSYSAGSARYADRPPTSNSTVIPRGAVNTTAWTRRSA